MPPKEPVVVAPQAALASDPAAAAAALSDGSEDQKARRARVRKLFDLIDDNHTGYLDSDNIVRRLGSLASGADNSGNPTFSESSAQMYAAELVKICDTSKDGTISFGEFEQFVARKEKEIQDLFLQITKTKGKTTITLSDLKTSFAGAGIVVSDVELHRFVNSIDANNDGVISFAEWRDFLLLMPQKLSLKTVIAFQRSVLDLDFNSDAVTPGLTNGDTGGKQIMYFLAGGLAGAVSRTATAPLDRMRVLLQTGTGNWSSSRAFVDGVKRIYQQGGIASFFRGNGLNVLKIVPESAIKFFAYEYFKSAITTLTGSKSKDDIGVSGRFAAGGAAGLVSQFCIYPLDTLKTRMMSQVPRSPAAAAANSRPPSIPETARAMWLEGTAERGARGGGTAAQLRPFFRGIGPALVGIVPYAGIDLAVFESLKVAYLKWRGGDEPLSTQVVMAFGVVSGGAGALVVHPIGLVRTRLQAQGTPSHPATYTGVMDVVRRTYAKESLSGFYKGVLPALLKVMPAVSISYGVYEAAKGVLGVR
ncbi:mitochondrial carrier domain-containing protein [Zopfochytrium polystomum]|nr:mitochondrial carrier domain-containing protein [Zopfochytrium polystomum]